MSSIPYVDFDLLIQRIGDGYRAHVLSSPAGQASTDFSSPFLPLELENFLLRVGRPRRGTRRIDSPEMDAAKAFGTRLFETAFGGEVRSALRSSLAEVDRQGAGLRIRLRLADTPELGDLPWEYLYDPTRHRFLVLSIETPLVRYLDLPERIRPLGVVPPIKVLVMISSPHDYPRLDVEGEWTRLREALGHLEQRGLLVLERLEEATLVALQRRLRRGPCHVFHFIGHGGFDQQAQDGQLILEDGSGRGRPVSGRDLGMLLHDLRSLRLAVLNACEGARTSRTDPFAGTAQSLAQSGIPAVIAMQFEITDEAAIAFAHEFYQAMADGYPVDAALAEARKAIFAQGNDVEWGTPVLYLRSPNGQIFEVASTSPPLPLQEREQDQQRSRLADLFEEVEAARTQENWSVAFEKLQAVLALEPTHAEAAAQVLEVRHALDLHTLYTTAQAHDTAGHWHEALDGFRQIQERHRDYKDVSARIETIRRAIERQGRLTALLEAAHAAKAQEDWAVALEKLQAVLALEPTHAEATAQVLEVRHALDLQTLYTTAQAHDAAGHWHEALDGFRQIQERHRDYKDVSARIETIRRAIERQGRLTALLEAAHAAKAQEDWAVALEKLQAVLALEPTHAEATAQVLEVRHALDLQTLYTTAQAHDAAGHWHEALDGFRQIQERHRDYKDVSARIETIRRAIDREKARLPPGQPAGVPPVGSGPSRPGRSKTRWLVGSLALLLGLSVMGLWIIWSARTGGPLEGGGLLLIGRLAGVEVWVGNDKIGETTTGSALVHDNLPPGSYRVKAQKPGYQPWEQEVQVRAYQRIEVVIDLTPLSERGGLALTSRMAGVEVWIGTDKLGETTAGGALVRDNLKSGSYRVKAQKPGYQPWEREIQITANQRTDVVIDLTPLPGSVAIISRVAGAEVWVGTDKLGETTAGSPLMRDNLPPGSYRVKARKPGYQPWEQEVQVRAYQRTEVVIDLQPLPGTVSLTSHVAGVEVWVGTDKLGETRLGSPLVRDNLPPDRYRVKAQKPGYQPWEQDIQVSADKRTEVAIDLQPLPGTVSITSHMAGVEVWVGTDKLGETRLGSPLVRDNFPPGRYRVKARKPGYQPWEQEVQVRAYQRTEVVIDLQPLPGTVSITSRVTGVEVWVGTDKLGETTAGSPLLRDTLPPGSYRVKALKSGYQLWEQDIQITPSQRTEVVIDLQPLPGTVSITSHVAGVEVWIGTDKLGETRLGSPLVRDNLPPGRYRVKAQKPGYQPWEQDIQVSADKRTEVAIDLQPLPGTVSITSHVAGVEVWVGTDKLGETRLGSPLVRDNLPPGRYRVKARKPGYQPWEQEVQVSADKRTEVVIDLQPLPGTVSITSRVTGVEVWVGTDKLGETTAGNPLLRDNLPPGSYRVKALKSGYQLWEQEVQITAGKRIDMVLELTPLPGSAAIIGHVAGAEVWIGTDKLGETTAGSALVRDNLPPGSYRIKAQKQGYRPWEREVQVTADKRTDVVIELTPLPELGTLVITGRVSGAEVWVGTNKIGKTTSAGSPLIGDNLTPGSYWVKAVKRGYQPWEQEIQVNANQRTEVVIDLQQLKPQPKPPVGKPRSEPPEVRLPPTPPVGKPPSGSPEVKLPPKPPVGKPEPEKPVVKSEPEKRKITIVAPTP